MAKPRKTYYKKRPLWQWVLFYLIIALVIYSLLYYSGVLGFGGSNNYPTEDREVEYFE